MKNTILNKIRETATEYAVKAFPEESILSAAKTVVKKRFEHGMKFTKPADAKEALVNLLATKPYEVFACLFLDNRHNLIKYEEMFRGTIAEASVHPREVVAEALRQNAAAVIFAHNHPSGDCEPSDADKKITQRLVSALDLVEIHVLDHIIVGGTETCSLAERGHI